MGTLKSPISDKAEDLVIRTRERVPVGESETTYIDRRISLAESCWFNRLMLWRLVWRSFLVMVIVAFVIPKTWVSDARLMPPEQNNNAGLSSLLASKATDTLPPGLADMLSTKGSQGAMFVGVLSSETVEDRLIDTFDLRKVYSVSTYKQAREILEERTSIIDDRRSGIITISVKDRDPVRARNLCSAYIEQLNKLVAELSTSSARRERIFLEGRLKEVRVELETAEKELSQFSSQHATLDVSEQGKAMLQSAATLQGELIAAQSELQGLQAIYTENNVRVRSLRARISELQRALQRLGGTSGDSGPADQSQEIYPSLRQLPILGVTYADLYRRTKTQETVFEVLTKQYELARVEEAKEIPTVRVLDPPLVPEKKSSPKRLQVIFAGTGLALLAGIIWIAAKRSWHHADPSKPSKLLIQEIGETLQRRTDVVIRRIRDYR